MVLYANVSRRNKIPISFWALLTLVTFGACVACGGERVGLHLRAMHSPELGIWILGATYTQMAALQP